MGGPKLRRLERLLIRRGDEQLVVLRDPLELSEAIAVDACHAPVLDALDGQRTLAQIRQSLLMRGLALVELDDLRDFVADLREAGMLDDDRFRELWAEAHAAFVEDEIREPRRAGLLYPEDPEQLRAWLAPALPSKGPSKGRASPSRAEEPSPATAWLPDPIALVTAHQPPSTLAPSLRRLLSSLPDPSRYRRVVILATDHTPGLLPYASADKDWATPLGPVACDLATLAALDQRHPWLLREQIRLRLSDPIEWATLLLRALWGDRCPPVLPIACGQTRLTTTEGAARGRELIEHLTELLGPATAAGEVLWWTSAELSHVGAAYGHGSTPDREQVERRDRSLLEPLLHNRPEQLARACMDLPPDARPSGAAALTTLAALLPTGYRATLLDYEALAAPGGGQGWIGCASVRISAGPPPL